MVMETLQRGDLVEVVKYGDHVAAVVGMKGRLEDLSPDGTGLYRLVPEPEDHATYWATLPRAWREMRDSESDRLEGWLVLESEIRKVEN